MSRITVWLACVMALAALTPGWAQELTFTDMMTGKVAPLSVPLKSLTPEWVRMCVSSQPGANEMARFTGMFTGQDAGVFYTKGQTVTMYGEKFLVAYGVPMKPIDPRAMEDGPRAPEPPSPDTALSLSLLNIRTLGSIQDIRPFNLKNETAPAEQPQRSEKVIRVESMNNLKQLAVAALMYCQDHDETLPDAKTWVEATAALGAKTLIVPGTEDRYQYNVALSGKSLGDIADPAETIIFYEPNAREGGFRIVAFADGHVEELNEKRWQQLMKQQ